MTTGARVGWCPGALRPMASGDGLILRVKPPNGVLMLPQAEALAAIATRCGNGLLDLTGRGNLQLRGIRAEAYDDALAALNELEMLDNSVEAEAVRNIVVSPLMGLEVGTGPDLRPVVADITALLTSDPVLQTLPAKWNIVIDDGGSLSLSEVAADLRFTAIDAGLQIGLGDDPAQAFCTAGDAVRAMAQLCRLALQGAPRRMVDVLRDRDAASIFATFGLAGVPAAIPRPAPAITDLVGPHALGRGIRLGVAAPFGSFTADDLRCLVRAAQRGHADEIRLTPWRVMLIPGVSAATAAAIETALKASGLITDPDDRRLRIAACSGAPACRRATTPVRDHAARLAAMPTPGAVAGPIAIHVSGCTKGCAHPARAPWTIVGRDGAYDVVRDGHAGDEPVIGALSFQDAATWISRAGDKGQA